MSATTASLLTTTIFMYVFGVCQKAVRGRGQNPCRIPTATTARSASTRTTRPRPSHSTTPPFHSLGSVLVIRRATAPPEPVAFAAAAQRALAALATRPGYVRGCVARALDDPDRWVVTCEWADVGSGRRGLTAGA